MSETKKQFQPSSEGAFRRDQRMALRQRLCWALIAAAAALGMLAIWRFVPREYLTYAAVLLAAGLLFLYRWVSAAPRRALNNWAIRCAGDASLAAPMLAFVENLQKSLPDAQKREMAYLLTMSEAGCLRRLGRYGEALEKLKAFDKIWDQSMRDQIDAAIRSIEKRMENRDAKEAD